MSEQVNYRTESYVYPTYRLSRIIQQTNGQEFDVGTNGGVESIFEIPVKCFNLAQSYLTFNITPPAIANNSTWFFTDTISTFLQIQLYTRSGIYLCDLNHASNYIKIVNKAETKMQDFLEYPTVQDSLINSQSIGRFLGRNNALGNSVTRTVASPYAQRFNNTAANVHYNEHKYLEPSSARNQPDPVLKLSIPLSEFKNTILALDKSIYLGEIVLLRFVWNGSNRIAFQNAGADDATSRTDPTAAPTNYTGTLRITNFALYLAVEKNQMVINQLLERASSGEGFKVLISYVHSHKTAPGLSSSHSLQYKFNRGHGMTLKRIYIAPFNITENSNVAYDHDNLAGNGKVNLFYTMLDNERLYEFDVSVAQNLDYQLMLPFLKGSVIQNANIYRHNWFWIEDFSDRDRKDGQDNANLGLDLSIERKWEFYATLINNGVGNANYNYYTFAVTQKILTVSSAGITVI